ncbi:hypothetical protein FVEN_g13065 [Fusarium venenatum]|nr:hypothetical protein FVEN_g13065 [Fusarium venenatum]
MMFGPPEPPMDEDTSAPYIEGDPPVPHPYRRSILDTIIPPVPTISTFKNGAQGRRTKFIG